MKQLSKNVLWALLVATAALCIGVAGAAAARHVSRARRNAMVARCDVPTITAHFLTADECQAVIRAAESAGMTRSEVEGDGISPVRTSFQVFLRHDVPAADRVVRKVEALLGVSRGAFEDLQVVRYEKGQKYEAHFDAEDTPVDEFRSDTVLMYLNDTAEGGETAFPKAGVMVTPRRGTAVWWRNTADDGTLLSCAFHGSRPVLRGTKYACTVWRRRKVS